MKSQQRRAISIRLDVDLLERLERLLQAMAPAYPSFKMSTADAVRLALHEGVAVLERRYRKRTRNHNHAT